MILPMEILPSTGGVMARPLSMMGYSYEQKNNAHPVT
jgi:hypothetical protein